MSERDVNALLDDLQLDPDVQRQWELNPEQVACNYSLTPTQKESLLAGDVDALISEGLAERHVQQVRVSW